MLTNLKLVGILTCMGIIILWFQIYMTLDIGKHLELIQPAIENDVSQIIDVFIVRPHFTDTPWNLLPNLSNLQWPIVSAVHPAGRIIDSEGHRASLPLNYEPVLSQGQRNLYQNLMQVVVRVLDEHGYADRYFLGAGTLLGSHRHHDFIPWDDDVDILVDVKLRSWLRDELKNLQPEYVIVHSERDKLFTQLISRKVDDEDDIEQSRMSTGQRWGWPFLDISYYDINGTHVVEVAPTPTGFTYWSIDTVFPFLYRPFGSHWYSTPKNPLAYLIQVYGQSADCLTSHHSHVFEKDIKPNRMKCRDLAKRYAFVEHRPCKVNDQIVQHGSIMLVEERLVLGRPGTGQHEIHKLCVASDVNNSWSDTYGLQFKKMSNISIQYRK